MAGLGASAAVPNEKKKKTFPQSLESVLSCESLGTSYFLDVGWLQCSCSEGYDVWPCQRWHMGP